MNAPMIPYRGLPSRIPLACGAALSLLMVAWPDPIQAEAVDSELVLLVDTTSAALNKTDFTRLMDGYAAAFSSTQILDSIQSGATGRIAVSLMFFGNTSSQQVGIPWMMIGNSTQAQQFANSLLNVTQPSWGGTSDIGAALVAATPFFGTETGETSNGFESAVQIIEVTEAKGPQNNSATSTAVSSAYALASGVDIINSLAIGNQADAIDAFYANNVIGSTLDGILATNTTSPANNSLATILTDSLNQTMQTGANTSITAVPESGTMLSLATGIIILLKRRRS